MSIDQKTSRDHAKLDLENLESSLQATVPWNRDSCCIDAAAVVVIVIAISLLTLLPPVQLSIEDMGEGA